MLISLLFSSLSSLLLSLLLFFSLLLMPHALDPLAIPCTFGFAVSFILLGNTLILASEASPSRPFPLSRAGSLCVLLGLLALLAGSLLHLYADIASRREVSPPTSTS